MVSKCRHNQEILADSKKQRLDSDGNGLRKNKDEEKEKKDI